jgi:hypothetical protein
MNIIEIIMKLLGSGDTISKIASLLGVGQDQAGKAVGAAVPSILAGLMGAASKPEGAGLLASILGKQDTGLLDNIGGLLGSGAESGVGSSNPLSSLLGGSGLGAIAGALGKFTGLGDSGSGKLLGMLTPVVLGAVGKASSGLDAGGIANMLLGQKANITSALPSGLGSILGSAVPGLSNFLGDATSAATNAASQAASAATGAAQSAARTATAAAHQAEKASSSIGKYLIPLLIAGAALFLLPKMCTKAGDKAADAANGAKAAVAGVADAVTDSKALSGDLSSILTTATEAIGTIKDEATATAALPKLQELTAKLGGLKALWDKMPAAAQSVVGSQINPLIAKLREVIQPVLALPVIGDKVKPIADEMLTALAAFAPAQP